MTVKVCPKCGERPSLRNERKNFAPYCKECSHSYFKERNQQRQAIIREAKNRPCMDCGKIYPSYVMDLDHRGDKFKNVSYMRSYSIKRLLEEIAKCDAVCANCHRERTHGPAA